MKAMNITRTHRDQALSADGSTARSTENDAVEPRKHRPTRLSGAHVWLLIGAIVLVLLSIFVAQNTQSTKISFVGTSIHVALAVALLIAAAAGGLLVGAIGGARIGQLRRTIRRDRQSTRRL